MKQEWETEITDGQQGNKMTLPEKHRQQLQLKHPLNIFLNIETIHVKNDCSSKRHSHSLKQRLWEAAETVKVSISWGEGCVIHLNNLNMGSTAKFILHVKRFSISSLWTLYMAFSTPKWCSPEEGRVSKETQKTSVYKRTSTAGFEPARGNPNRFQVYRLNHSAILTACARFSNYFVHNSNFATAFFLLSFVLGSAH